VEEEEEEERERRGERSLGAKKWRRARKKE